MGWDEMVLRAHDDVLPLAGHFTLSDCYVLCPLLVCGDIYITYNICVPHACMHVYIYMTG